MTPVALVALCATYPAMQLMQLKLQGLCEGGGAGDKEKHLAVRDLSRHGGVQLHLNEGRIVYCAHILSNTPHILQLPRRTCVLLHRGMQLSSLSDCLNCQKRVCFTTSMKFTGPVQGFLHPVDLSLPCRWHW